MGAVAAVLFARSDSVYKDLGNCDVWDVDRDARGYDGVLPVVAHPPCRAWGRLRTFANPRPDEKELAFFAVDQVRRVGGVLEHPASSTLWGAAGLPLPLDIDSFGGWTLPIVQSWFGHRAEKKTWLYIVGVRPLELPVMPLVLGRASHVIGSSKFGLPGCRPEVSRAEREHTPRALAEYLVNLATRCRVAG